ncbi:TadE/TadG family type IV pilus assembly protein [Qiania dongpingensis]|uniref:Pilus assembly protein n=1 Tax=Qiania dongpingensis TaxID=2763669 RepID=A0A7G9G182_9FIRM|nr:TadE family protein [Qiania dongpingensis]QNM04564.1 pilus assembly protein [Qiania dongpingensis]
MNGGKWLISRKIEGGYTVEAAFLLPLGFALILLVVSYSFIFRDKVTICAGVHEAAEREAFQKTGNNQKETKYLETLSCPDIPIQISRGETMVTVKCGGKSQFLSRLIQSLFFLREPYLEKREEIGLLYGEQVIRDMNF